MSWVTCPKCRLFKYQYIQCMLLINSSVHIRGWLKLLIHKLFGDHVIPFKSQQLSESWIDLAVFLILVSVWLHMFACVNMCMSVAISYLKSSLFPMSQAVGWQTTLRPSSGFTSMELFQKFGNISYRPTDMKNFSASLKSLPSLQPWNSNWHLIDSFSSNRGFYYLGCFISLPLNALCFKTCF